MKSFVWLVLGVAAGFVIAHLVNRTPGGRAFFTDVDTRAREFTGGIVDGYRSREAELRHPGDDSAGPGAAADDSARASA